MTTALESCHAAGAAFDAMAARYDETFTFSTVGRAQREVVWNHAARTFHSGDHILELNCGTGEDALFLAHRGIHVTACDASERMIYHAKARKDLEAPHASISFRVLPTEHVYELAGHQLCDGVFSNFSGLNCVADLRQVARTLSSLLHPGAKLLLCFSTRFCIWELFYYTARGNFRKAVRRWRGVSPVSFDNQSFFVYYPTIRALRKSFAPEFTLRSVTGIGISVPPSYLERWIGKHPRLLSAMMRFDKAVCDLPLFRNIGDHMLLLLEKC
ncbi:class I SAM-dependent methyltransferase [Alloacidobacterium sp.]|uniref:class I SAM-dependent methyltransferase n=1 Tax=Alloacidobacterium sp. TaxID=2951999 RepID=UPI002D677D8B|nr:class I SAM-dependent methyltransferase [Alloacidobacterium sp.]HYK35153.1 class I SAM-dependent methyltransferase [Alloacidobacterium sp.]